MLVWPAVPTIANQLAPKGKEGFYQGFVNSAATGGRMIGPLLGGVLVDQYGMSVLLLILIFRSYKQKNPAETAGFFYVVIALGRFVY
jgi:MFS family permease